MLYINEENGGRGSEKYKEISDKQKLNHIFAIESDAGGFRPLGFSFTTNNNNFLKLLEWKKYFAPYLSLISLRYFKSGSPSINKVSDDASSLKFFEKYPKKHKQLNNKTKMKPGFFNTIF